MTYAAVVAETIRSLKQKDIQKIYENDSPFVNRIRVGTHLYSCFEVLVPLKLTVAECSVIQKRVSVKVYYSKTQIIRDLQVLAR